MIPKVLHFCWFGNASPPPLVNTCLESWREHMPEYKIMDWRDDDLPDVPYVKTALANKKYANVSNYMRFHILNQHGGIYLDTDIEAVKSFDGVLDNQMFVGWQGNGQINNAVMGAVPGHPLIKFGLDALPKRFGGVEKANLSSPFFITDILKVERSVQKADFNELVHASDVTVYPTRFFYPHWFGETLDRAKHVVPDTICIHHWAAMWKE